MKGGLCLCTGIGARGVAPDPEHCPYHTWYLELNHQHAVAEYLRCSMLELGQVDMLTYNRVLAMLWAEQDAQTHFKPASETVH